MAIEQRKVYIEREGREREGGGRETNDRCPVPVLSPHYPQEPISKPSFMNHEIILMKSFNTTTLDSIYLKFIFIDITPVVLSFLTYYQLCLSDFRRQLTISLDMTISDSHLLSNY